MKLMTKEQFEKKHGRVYHNGIHIDHAPNDDLKAELLAEYQPEHRWMIAKHFPGSHFCSLGLHDLKIIFDNLKEETNANVIHYYLRYLDHRYFSCGWGWFSRGGQGLSTHNRSVSDIDKNERAEGVKVIKLFKEKFQEFGYYPKYGKMQYMNDLIVIYGGKVDNAREDSEARKRLRDREIASDNDELIDQKVRSMCDQGENTCDKNDKYGHDVFDRQKNIETKEDLKNWLFEVSAVIGLIATPTKTYPDMMTMKTFRKVLEMFNIDLSDIMTDDRGELVPFESYEEDDKIHEIVSFFRQASRRVDCLLFANMRDIKKPGVVQSIKNAVSKSVLSPSH
ncbi:MAG: hypothetical protein FWD33_00625 [Alphaproteobacteria bacterium]|nr:hypothetical protein [Alphaproteobacteria bacterium]